MRTIGLGLVVAAFAGGCDGAIDSLMGGGDVGTRLLLYAAPRQSTTSGLGSTIGAEVVRVDSAGGIVRPTSQDYCVALQATLGTLVGAQGAAAPTSGADAGQVLPDGGADASPADAAVTSPAGADAGTVVDGASPGSGACTGPHCVLLSVHVDSQAAAPFRAFALYQPAAGNAMDLLVGNLYGASCPPTGPILQTEHLTVGIPDVPPADLAQPEDLAPPPDLSQPADETASATTDSANPAPDLADQSDAATAPADGGGQ